MQFEIFQNKNLIQGISDTSFGSINEKRAVKFLKFLGYKNINSRKIIWAQQVFSSRVYICKELDSEKTIRNVDGLIAGLFRFISSFSVILYCRINTFSASF